jgi:hypothetical protein
MAAAALRMGPQLPRGEHDPGVGIRRSIAEGLCFVRGNQALKGSFAIDLLAMTFGMPRALFPVLSITVYGTGAAGTGVLFAAVSAGATVALRGRMSSVFMIVVTSGPRLGDVESGTVASLSSARFSVVSGGLACVAGIGLVLLAFPALLAYDAERTKRATR